MPMVAFLKNAKIFFFDLGKHEFCFVPIKDIRRQQKNEGAHACNNDYGCSEYHSVQRRQGGRILALRQE